MCKYLVGIEKVLQTKNIKVQTDCKHIHLSCGKNVIVKLWIAMKHFFFFF